MNRLQRMSLSITALALSGCAGSGMHGIASSATALPTATATTGPIEGVRIGSDERTRVLHLWVHGDVEGVRRELRRILHTAVHNPNVAHDAADAAFLRGDFGSSFRAYSARGFVWSVQPATNGFYSQTEHQLNVMGVQPRDRITANFLIGDTHAACGRFMAARKAWLQALRDDAGFSGGYVWYPEWTSAVRRLLAYEGRIDHEQTGVQCITDEEVQAANAKRIADGDVARDRLHKAWSLLKNGHAEESLAEFERSLIFRQNDQQEQGDLDAERGIIFAALSIGQDVRAEKALEDVHKSVPISNGTELIFHGQWNDAFGAYRDATAKESGGMGTDPLITKGVAQAQHGDMLAAIKTWSGRSDNYGPYDLHDEQRALCGVGFARLGRWSDAVRAWLDASSIPRVEPQLAAFETGNFIALDMLYHFRAHYREVILKHGIPKEAFNRSEF